MEKNKIDLMKRYWIVSVVFDPKEGEKGEVLLTTNSRSIVQGYEAEVGLVIIKFDAQARKFL
jgi:hypothetical protein